MGYRLVRCKCGPLPLGAAVPTFLPFRWFLFRRLKKDKKLNGPPASCQQCIPKLTCVQLEHQCTDKTFPQLITTNS